MHKQKQFRTEGHKVEEEGQHWEASDMGNLMKLGSDTPLLLLILIVAAISCQGKVKINLIGRN